MTHGEILLFAQFANRCGVELRDEPDVVLFCSAAPPWVAALAKHHFGYIGLCDAYAWLCNEFGIEAELPTMGDVMAMIAAREAAQRLRGSDGRKEGSHE